MTGDLYRDWIQQWDRELQVKKQKALLLQDNFSGHIVPSGLQCIRVENFPPNLTAHVQPKDQGIIQCFKAHYWANFIQCAIDRYDQGITPGDIYEINQLQAMRLADEAWREVDTTTIRNCWHKAGILPDSNSPPPTNPSILVLSLLHESSSCMDPVVQAEKQVESVLDELVATGVLQKGNQMDIESLLNPLGESHVMTETSDKEIYQAVMDAIDACENIEINGGNDIDDNLNARLEPHPTRRDVLKAASTIGTYVGTINDPLARKMESILGSFNRQLRLDEASTMKATCLMDYFHN